MEFQFHLNLRRMALHAAALLYWNREDIQCKLRQFLYPYGRKESKEYLDKLIKEVIKKIDSESLPDFLYCELVLAVKDLGYKMNDWFCYLKRRKICNDQSRRQVYDKFFRKIYWTHYGSINEVKILRDFWFLNPNIDLMKVYIMACCYCLEDVIKNLWGKISQNQMSYKNLCSSFGFHLVVYWNKLRENDLEGFKNDIIIPYSAVKIYEVNKSVEVNMLKLAVAKGFISAVKYFWNKITQEERDNNIVFCFTEVMDMYGNKLSHEFHRKEQCTEICMFLINFLTENSKRDIFTDTKKMLDLGYWGKYSESYLDSILEMVVCMWPWQDLFQPVYKEIEDFLDERQYKSLINKIIDKIGENSKFDIPQQNSIAQTQFFQVWFSTPPKFKAALCKKIWLYYLLKNETLSNIKLILNDRHVANERQNALKKFYPFITSFVEEGNDELFFKIINEIIIPQGQQENFKLLYKLIFKGELTLANEALDCYSDEEKVDIKSEINHELICYYFILKDQLDQADEFLKWKFNDQEKINEYKISFFDDKFTLSHIKMLWETSKENVQVAITKCQNFLLWFLENEITVLHFKLQHIVSQLVEFEGFDWGIFLNGKHIEVVDDFVQWCTERPELAGMIRRMIVGSDFGLSSVLESYMRKNSTDEADKLLNWAFDSKDEKKAFMQKFLFKKDGGILACKLYVGKFSNSKFFEPKPTAQEVTEKLTKFINFFLRPFLESFDELKRKLKDWPEVSERNHVQTVDSDGTSSDNNYSEFYSDDDEDFVYCDVDNYKLFLNLLDSAECESE